MILAQGGREGPSEGEILGRDLDERNELGSPAGGPTCAKAMWLAALCACDQEATGTGGGMRGVRDRTCGFLHIKPMALDSVAFWTISQALPTLCCAATHLLRTMRLFRGP